MANKMYNLARAFGEKACRAFVTNGYDAIYASVKFIKNDEQARAFKKACVAFIWRNQAKVSTAISESGRITVQARKAVVGFAWLAELMTGVKTMSLASAQKASGYKKEMVTTVSFTTRTLKLVSMKRAAVWTVIQAFKSIGLVADMAFRATRGVVFNIADRVMESKDMMADAIVAAKAWEEAASI